MVSLLLTFSWKFRKCLWVWRDKHWTNMEKYQDEPWWTQWIQRCCPTPNQSPWTMKHHRCNLQTGKPQHLASWRVATWDLHPKLEASAEGAQTLGDLRDKARSERKFCFTREFCLKNQNHQNWCWGLWLKWKYLSQQILTLPWPLISLYTSVMPRISHQMMAPSLAKCSAP